MTLLTTRAGMILATCLAATVGSAGAQNLQAQLAPPLDLKPVDFSDEVRESMSPSTDVANAVFKPAGDGPFPAVVLMHSCGGLVGAPNAHVKEHAQQLLAAGYVTLVIDSFQPRGFDNCAARVPATSTGIVDAYAALDFLAAKPFVDATRVYQVGYSWGAFISAFLASPQSAGLASSQRRFAATVANYGGCAYKTSQIVLRDIDRPLLMLLGERDREVPAAPCFPLLDELKAAGAPVHWHVYLQTTHGWDKPGLPTRGYTYSAQVTQDARRRALDFLSQPR